MNDQSSNSSIPQEFTPNQANVKANVFETYTTQLSHLSKFQKDGEIIDTTVKNVPYNETPNATTAEELSETTEISETATEGESVTESETTIDNDDETTAEETLKTEIAVISQQKIEIEHKKVTINEDVQVLKDDTKAFEKELVITGDDIIIEERQQAGSNTYSSFPTLELKSSPSLKKIKAKLVSIIGQDHLLGLGYFGRCIERFHSSCQKVAILFSNFESKFSTEKVLLMIREMPLIDKIQLELGAQEPWPKDVKLYQPYEVEQILLPDNANCLAVQAFLRMCDLDFEVVARANAEFMSPSGKVPFIKCGAFIVSELEGIVQFVNNKGISLTTNMESEQKSDMRAYMSLVHNVLENAELYLCWCDKETYNEVTKPRNGSVYPWPLNYFQTWSKKAAVCKRLKMMGWYNKSLEDVYQEVENCCQALTDRLEGKEYFFGKNCTEMDAIVYGHIYAVLTTSLSATSNRLAYLVQQFEKLTDHCRRIHKQVMKQDDIFVVTRCSTALESGNETETENNLPTDSEDVQDTEDYEDIASEASVDGYVDVRLCENF